MFFPTCFVFNFIGYCFIYAQDFDQFIFKYALRWLDAICWSYLHLDHQASLSSKLDNVSVNVHPALGFQTLHHGIDADVGAGSADSSATQNRNNSVFILNTTLCLKGAMEN